jgi:predicted enzyme related to lactoylglutathione lyase
MAKVTGIGGVFFKAKDMDRMKDWYRDMLGIPLEADQAYGIFNWRDKDNAERIGGTVWSLFAADSDYFDPATAPMMVNYRVDNLDEALADLRARGVTIVGEPMDMEGVGRFGWVLDPEGNKIELWEPQGEPGQDAK